MFRTSVPAGQVSIENKKRYHLKGLPGTTKGKKNIKATLYFRILSSFILKGPKLLLLACQTSNKADIQQA